MSEVHGKCHHALASWSLRYHYSNLLKLIQYWDWSPFMKDCKLQLKSTIYVLHKRKVNLT